MATNHHTHSLRAAGRQVSHAVRGTRGPAVPNASYPRRALWHLRALPYVLRYGGW